MSLRDLELRAVYDTEHADILRDFYIPAFSKSVLYQRSVGYFSASILSIAAQGLAAFVSNGGKIELIVGAFIDQDDLSAANQSYILKEAEQGLIATVNNLNDEMTSQLFQCRLRTIAWLVKNDILEIKVALRRNGIFHEKVGIITDAMGDAIIFNGSANETQSALTPGYNFESINVFPSWKVELREHFSPHQKKFNLLWANEHDGTLVIPLPDAVKDHLVRVANEGPERPNLDSELQLWDELNQGRIAKKDTSRPRVPKILGKNLFSIRDHQRLALKNWQDQKNKGILALATGAGKTITALYAATRLSERVPGLIMIVAVPYQDLANQWCDVMREFNMSPIECYRSFADWERRLGSAITNLQYGNSTFVAVVVVNRTLKSEHFQRQLKRINTQKLLWIGDECHHHGSESFDEKIPLNTAYKLGLSATPDHYIDQEHNSRLKAIYGETVFSYTLQQAIIDRVLTPYHYHVVPVTLTPDEADNYVAISRQIAKLIATGANNSSKDNSSFSLQAKLRERSRIIGSAKNKIHALKTVIDGFESPVSHSLFYCGDGQYEDEDSESDNTDDPLNGKRQIDVVSELLKECGWRNSRFTSREKPSERLEILENFKSGSISSLVAIRCLDEGIDIPACSTAFILASSRDPRQFIQRRGRILRRSEGKSFATVYDFLVTLEPRSDFDIQTKRLIKAELERVAEFARMSLNYDQTYEVLRPILNKYDLEHCL